MLDKAIDLLAGAQALHGDGNDHAAILLAIHSGINSADAINEFYGEPFSGEHRKAPDHLRQWDPKRLSDAARQLRHLVGMKATVAVPPEAIYSSQHGGCHRDSLTFGPDCPRPDRIDDRHRDTPAMKPALRISARCGGSMQ